MAGPLKRTGMRSSPEDAAFFRKFHDFALSSQRKGVSRELLLRDLETRGVPAKTAERIVIAVEQEHAASALPQGVPRGKRWMVVVAILVVLGATSVYIVLQMSKDRTLKAEYLLPAGIVVLVLSAVVLSRLLLRQGPRNLPPPPEPPS